MSKVLVEFYGELSGLENPVDQNAVYKGVVLT